MKKIFSLLFIGLTLITLLPKNLFASETGYFIVTAYYSPLPGQNYYITGNYESEKKLNGHGIAGASGKKVFSGMLAAPGKYSFGTKIELDGLGIGSVDDRGGAIVPAGERGYGHDRIDVWVGSGDEGLRRAMYWGKRKVAGKVIGYNSDVTLDYNTIPAPTWAVPKTTILYGQKVQVAQHNLHIIEEELDIFSISLGRGSAPTYVEKLQNILREVGYFNQKDSDGIYDTHTIDAVYNFQINNEIISSETSIGAGSYGPKTRKKLREIYSLYLEELKLEEEFKENITIIQDESFQLSKREIETLGKPTYGDISPEVRSLQIILAKLGHFDYKDTAIFGVKTQNALLEFQLNNNIISSIDELGAGVFGPKTREVAMNKLGEHYFHDVLIEKGFSEKYKHSLTVSEYEEEKEAAHKEILIYSI